jgi:hypothetical protein
MVCHPALRTSGTLPAGCCEGTISGKTHAVLLLHDSSAAVMSATLQTGPTKHVWHVLLHSEDVRKRY